MYGDIYTVKYQKYIHFLIYFYIDNQIFDISKIDEVDSIQLLIKKNDSTRKLFVIILLVISHDTYRN